MCVAELFTSFCVLKLTIAEPAHFAEINRNAIPGGLGYQGSPQVLGYGEFNFVSDMIYDEV